jgi:methylenetetrahydrofolate--tRNA-(uracil-5-)-methyltransferase
MRRAGSILLAEADATAVPAGHALAVDRVEFSKRVAARIEAYTTGPNPLITVHREEVTHLNENDPDTITILASGPLTSPALAAELQRLTGSDHLAFYDSISPIVDATTIDMSKVYFAARYDKGTADYINCPFTKEEYDRFMDALTTAEAVEAKDWEKFPATGTAEKLQYFEGCLPIEETARRGRDTLRFGPMKPVGLTDPKTGRWPYAVVQLRQENLRADSYNLVGFQNHLKYGEQNRVLKLIPGLEDATFLRYGQIHRNTYIHAPSLLTETLQLRAHPGIMIAGQLSGVEGYTESIASGMLAGIYAAAIAQGRTPEPAPRSSANGSLTHYITHAADGPKASKKFQPANITFDLLPPLEEDLRKKIRDKKERHRLQCDRALGAWNAWLADSKQFAVRPAEAAIPSCNAL